MNKKQMTYAEHQYRKALSYMRDLRNPEYTDDHKCWVERQLDNEIEESYIRKAKQTIYLRHKRERYDLNFWFSAFDYQRWTVKNIPMVIKINKHIQKYIAPY